MLIAQLAAPAPSCTHANIQVHVIGENSYTKKAQVQLSTSDCPTYHIIKGRDGIDLENVGGYFPVSISMNSSETAIFQSVPLVGDSEFGPVTPVSGSSPNITSFHFVYTNTYDSSIHKYTLNISDQKLGVSINYAVDPKVQNRPPQNQVNYLIGAIVFLVSLVGIGALAALFTNWLNYRRRLANVPRRDDWAPPAE